TERLNRSISEILQISETVFESLSDLLRRFPRLAALIQLVRSAEYIVDLICSNRLSIDLVIESIEFLVLRGLCGDALFDQIFSRFGAVACKEENALKLLDLKRHELVFLLKKLRRTVYIGFVAGEGGELLLSRIGRFRIGVVAFDDMRIRS